MKEQLELKHYENKSLNIINAQSQTQELIEIIKELTPMAEDGYKLHKKNGSHQDFLEDDRDILKKAKELLTKYNHLNKKP